MLLLIRIIFEPWEIEGVEQLVIQVELKRSLPRPRLPPPPPLPHSAIKHFLLILRTEGILLPFHCSLPKLIFFTYFIVSPSPKGKQSLSQKLQLSINSFLIQTNA
jgi:hypothetical protein